MSYIIKKVKLYSHVKKNKQFFTKFANKVGLVYFGFVNQHTDDHKIIRGFTVSTKHNDNHYSVGSIGGYNVSIVYRTDFVSQPNKSEKLYKWLIVAFDLHTKMPIPHIFIGAQNNEIKSYQALFSTYPNMKDINNSSNTDYSPEFTNRFTLFARPAKTDDVEQIFDDKAAIIMATHFWPFSVEQHDNVLYVYASDEKITENLLNTMLENGLWFAGYIDNKAESL